MTSHDPGEQAVGGRGVTPAVPADVPVLHHPHDEARRRRLAGAGVPRVLVVAEGADPLVCVDPIEDWLRSPVDPDELEQRRRVVLGRYQRHTQGIRVDDEGRLRVGTEAAPLSPLQRAALFPLLHQLGRPVARSVVEEEYLAAGGHHPRGLASLLDRLRPRLATVGLSLHILRDGGVLLLPPPAERP
jgi:two-component system OmpR family response regulator